MSVAKGDRVLYLGNIGRAVADEAGGDVSIQIYGETEPETVAASAVTVTPLPVREPVEALVYVGRLTGGQ